MITKEGSRESTPAKRGRIKGGNESLERRLLDPSTGVPILGTTEDVSRLFGIHYEQTLRLARAGKIPGAKKIGSQWRFRMDKLMEA